MSLDLVLPCLLGATGLLLWMMGVVVADKQPRVRWGNWQLPEARVPRVFERVRPVDDEGASHERFSAVFPLPPDAGVEHSELGSRDVRRIG